ncbi:Ribonuclease H [Purpureocillium takamizusanense]|uniref:Ribonuclease H n=1 Tax=Purpureocillium takamizusanense TaxID=2060973 RepID=A0A9Q8QBY4_9HYPO|nr:Ribonuclease H [Purpureocillium takamizusanense]UNI17844.1 Ribonuclease H [Purpureocillium takamizusanense]
MDPNGFYPSRPQGDMAGWDTTWLGNYGMAFTNGGMAPMNPSPMTSAPVVPYPTAFNLGAGPVTGYLAPQQMGMNPGHAPHHGPNGRNIAGDWMPTRPRSSRYGQGTPRPSPLNRPVTVTPASSRAQHAQTNPSERHEDGTALNANGQPIANLFDPSSVACRREPVAVYNHEKSLLQLESPVPEHMGPRVFPRCDRESLVVCCGVAVPGGPRAAWSVFCGWGSKYNEKGVLGPESGVTLSEHGVQAYAASKAVNIVRKLHQGDRTLRHVYIVSSSKYVESSLTVNSSWFESSKDGGMDAAQVIRDTLAGIKDFERSRASRRNKSIKLWYVPLEENKQAQELAAQALEAEDEVGEEGSDDTFDQWSDQGPDGMAEEPSRQSNQKSSPGSSEGTVKGADQGRTRESSQGTILESSHQSCSGLSPGMFPVASLALAPGSPLGSTHGEAPGSSPGTPMESPETVEATVEPAGRAQITVADETETPMLTTVPTAFEAGRMGLPFAEPAEADPEGGQVEISEDTLYSHMSPEERQWMRDWADQMAEEAMAAQAREPEAPRTVSLRDLSYSTLE